MRNTSKYRDAIDTLEDMDDSSSGHAHDSRKNSPSVKDDGSVSSLSDSDNGSDADCSKGYVLQLLFFYSFIECQKLLNFLKILQPCKYKSGQ